MSTKPTYTSAPKAEIPTPLSCTEEVFNGVVAQLSTHYSSVLTPTVMITARKGCYATVINTMVDNVPLEQLLGSVNSKVATDMVLRAVQNSYSSITTKVVKSSKAKA